MAEPLLDVETAKYLKAQGFGDLYSDRSRKRVIFVGEEPANKDHGVTETVTVLEDGGGASEVSGLVENRSLVLRIQGDEYEPAKALSQRLNRALNEQQGILSPNIQVARVRANANPIYLGKNSNELHQFSMSFTVQMKRIIPTTGADFNPSP